MLLLIVLYALAAASFTLAKAALAYTHPIFLVGVRMLIAGCLLLGYHQFRRASFSIVRSDYFRFALIVGVHIYLAFVLDLVALNYMTSFKGAFIYNLSPFFAALFSYFYFHERMTAKKWLGLSIGFLGFLPEFIVPTGSEECALGCMGVISWPEIMMVGSVLASVVGWIVVRSLVKDGYSPFFVNGIGMLGGGLLALLTSPFFEVWNVSLVTNWWGFLYTLTLVIIVSNVLFYNLYGYLLKRYTATFLSFAGFLTPIFAAFFGCVFLGEQIMWHYFFSIFVVALGLWIFYSEELAQGYVVKTH